MDLHELWQENKRWILGVLAGVLVYFIAGAVIDSTFSSSKIQRERKRLAGQITKEQYRKAAKAEANQNRQAVRSKLDNVRQAMNFELPPDYALEGKADPELHYSTTNGRVRDELFDRASTANVELPESALVWSPPTTREEIRDTLVGLCLVREAVMRLIAAHQKVTTADYEALGLRNIKQFRIEQRRNKRRSTVRREEGQKLATDFLNEHFVTFEFFADYASVLGFLESFHADSMNLGLDSIDIELGRKPGDPLRVKGRLVLRQILPVQLEEQS